MRADFNDLDALEGSGGVPFQHFLFDLIVAEARTCGIPPGGIRYDSRVNIGDGGRDIIVEADHDRPNPRFIPQRRSIWSAKSGADGKDPSTLRGELRDPAHAELQNHLKAGGKYLWCTLIKMSQGDRDELRNAADQIAAEIGFDPSQIEFRDREKLIPVLNDWPNLVAIHLPGVAISLKGVVNLIEWQRQDRVGFAVKWVPFAGRAELKDRIVGHLLANDGPNVLHIAGLSGVGKTRTALQACLDTRELSGAFYVPEYEGISDDFFRYIEQTGRHAVVIIDEMPLRKLDAFISRLSDFRTRLRFLTMGPARRSDVDRQPSDPTLLILEEPTTASGVFEVVKSAGEGIPDGVLHSIASASAHDLRLALLLVRATQRHPEFRERPLVDIDDIWHRLMKLFAIEVGDASQFRRRYESLTPFVDVGHAGEYRNELTFLAVGNGVPLSDMDVVLATAHNCGLGNRTVHFFEPSPRALSLGLFQDRVWPRIHPNLGEYLHKMPERLKRRFVERCQDCEGNVRKEVELALGATFRQILGSPRLSALGEREPSRVFKAWAELDPLRGLEWLGEAVDLASDREMSAFEGSPDGSGGWRGRRQIVWLCEHLACFSEFFFSCEHMLFRLAQVETEPEIGNNSTNTWRSMFWPILSHTEVPFAARLELLLRRLEESSDKATLLVMSAAIGVIAQHKFRLSPPRTVGGRIVPAEWKPATGQALRDLLVEAGRRIIKCAGKFQLPKWSIAASTFVSHFGEIVQLGLVSDLKEFFGTFEDESWRRQLQAKLEEYLAIFRRGSARRRDGAAVMKELEDWRAELAPRDLGSRIRALTSRDFWSVARSIDQGQLSLEAAGNSYANLAGAALGEPGLLANMGDWFSNPDAKSVGVFAQAVGRLDSAELMKNTVASWMAKGYCPEFVISYVKGVAEGHGGSLPTFWKVALTSVLDTQPMLVARVSLNADISPSGFVRIMQAAPMIGGAAMNLVSGFGFGSWPTTLTDPEKTELLKWLRDASLQGDTNATRIAYALIAAWSESGKRALSTDIGDLVVWFARRSASSTDEIDPYDWEVALRLLSKSDFGEVVDILADALTAMTDPQHSRQDVALELLKELAPKNPSEAMNAVGKRILDSRRRPLFGMWSFEGLFEAIGLTAIRTWISEHDPQYIYAIARHVASPTINKDGQAVVPELTQWLLTEFESDGRMFREFLTGRHSWETVAGHARDRRAAIELAVKPFLEHKIRLVREWAQYELKRNEEDAELDDRLDDLDSHQ